MSTLPRGQSILVIDDDPMVAGALRSVLEGDNDVMSVGGAQKGLDLMASGMRFDVILCDLMMPVMTGMDLHAALSRAYPEMVERLIFVTGGTFTPEAQEFLDGVRHPILEKPFLARNLRALVGGMARRS